MKFYYIKGNLSIYLSIYLFIYLHVQAVFKKIQQNHQTMGKNKIA